jgi:hypothetical protein
VVCCQTLLEGACVAYEVAVNSYETMHKQGRLIAKRAADRKPANLSWSMCARIPQSPWATMPGRCSFRFAASSAQSGQPVAPLD